MLAHTMLARGGYGAKYFLGRAGAALVLIQLVLFAIRNVVISLREMFPS